MFHAVLARFARNDLHALPETLNGLHETLHNHTKRLTVYTKRFSQVSRTFFGVVVSFRVCKFCHHATILNLHIVFKNLEIFLNKEVILEKRLRVL